MGNWQEPQPTRPTDRKELLMLYKTYALSKRQHGLITLHGVKTQITITEVKLVYERC